MNPPKFAHVRFCKVMTDFTYAANRNLSFDKKYHLSSMKVLKSLSTQIETSDGKAIGDFYSIFKSGD